MAENETTKPSHGNDAVAGELHTRAQFLTKASIGLGGLLGVAIGVPVAGMALAPAFEGQKKHRVSVGKTDAFTEGEFTKVTLDFAEQGDVDAYVRKRVAFVRKNAGDYTDKLTGKQEAFTIISNRCAHLGCPVQNASPDSFVCPCHGGAYDGDGARIEGPPVRPLDRFDWEVEGGELFVTGEYSLTNDGKRKDLRGPGQETDAPIGWLFPLQP